MRKTWGRDIVRSVKELQIENERIVNDFDVNLSSLKQKIMEDKK